MVHDPEKAELKVNGETPQDLDCPVEHPGVSTFPDKETKKNDTDGDSSHSHSSNGTIEAIPEDIEPAQPSKSRSSSVRSRPISIPRSKRRGLLARFTIIPEVQNPHDYKRSIKWFITFQVAIAAAAAPMGSAIILRKYNTFPTYWTISINISRSRTSPTLHRFRCNSNHHQPFRCPLHAKHVHLSTMVVLLL
jgi:hypothetical protein